MGFPGFLVRVEWGQASAGGGPKEGAPLQLGDAIYMRHRPGGHAPLRARVSCPGGRAGGRSGLGFSSKVEHPQPSAGHGGGRLLGEVRGSGGWRDGVQAFQRSEHSPLPSPKDLVNIEMFLTAKEVEESLERRETATCLAWCHDNKSRLRKMKVWLPAGPGGAGPLSQNEAPFPSWFRALGIWS